MHRNASDGIIWPTCLFYTIDTYSRTTTTAFRGRVGTIKHITRDRYRTSPVTKLQSSGSNSDRIRVNRYTLSRIIKVYPVPLRVSDHIPRQIWQRSLIVAAKLQIKCVA